MPHTRANSTRSGNSKSGMRISLLQDDSPPGLSCRRHCMRKLGAKPDGILQVQMILLAVRRIDTIIASDA